MIWVVDASRFRQNIEFFRPINHVNAQVNFDWKWWRKPWLYARMPIFFDFGECEINYPDCITGKRKDTRITYENSLFWVKRMEEFHGEGSNYKHGGFFHGGGTWVNRKRFIERYRDGIGKPVNQQFPLVRRLTLNSKRSSTAIAINLRIPPFDKGGGEEGFNWLIVKVERESFSAILGG